MDSTNSKKETYRATGLMSGTSLDGVDIAFCTFEKTETEWSYRIEKAETIPYPDTWKNRLSGLENQDALTFAKADSEYGHYLGKITDRFLRKHDLKPFFIASHGHTIFHQPGSGFTSQIGKGPAIAAETGYPVVCDFRSTDVAFGGQGAPLVPAGDRFLFGEYTYCLNLGGFANISFEKSGQRIAFDICPANIVLNYLVASLEKEYDDGGKSARRGKLHKPLLEALDSLIFYQTPPPKSLGKEWVLAEVHPLLNQFAIPVEDKLRTYTEHIAGQVVRVAGKTDTGSLLITGGGAFNTFLIEKIRENARLTVILPDPLTINFKEALIFAFLGVLRWRGEVNCLKSVTGARIDTIGGAIYQAF
ncbi:MAG: anhydro-N-acetylmuramic acid kinase [Bacteroidetes bacterium]|nr:anhydro-N-acetylmuramic acid kinase [Bacteroidota bacterium]